MPLRGLTLLGLAVASGTRLTTEPLLAVLLLATAAAWTLLAGLRATVGSPHLMRPVGVVIDLLATVSLFWLGGGPAGALGWSGLLLVLSTGMHWGVLGALLGGLTAAILQGAIALLFVPPLQAGLFAAGVGGLYLALGLPLGWAARRISGRPRASKAARPEGNATAGRKALYALLASLSASLNYVRVLETAMDVTASVLGEDPAQDRLVGAALLFSAAAGPQTPAQLEVTSARRFTPADLRLTFPARAGILPTALEADGSNLLANPASDPELGRIIALRTCTVACLLPLRNGLETYGLLLYAHPEAPFFNTQRRETLEVIANQIAVAIQNARLYQDLAHEKDRMMEIQEEARKKLARDLHDGPTQSVAAIAMRVNLARRLIDRNLPAAADELFKIEDLARRTTKEIRHMLFTLRPLVLESQGLVAALEAMAEKMDETFHQKVSITADPQLIAELEMGKLAVIFYIAEEAVNNARKHAQAEQIWVRLNLIQPDLGLLEIEDNGVGFDLAAVDASYDQRGSLGMLNMRERAELLNGLLKIDSAVGKGTRIRVLIPLNEEASDRMRRGT
jgi:signal transduction histidine kinase